MTYHLRVSVLVRAVEVVNYTREHIASYCGQIYDTIRGLGESSWTCTEGVTISVEVSVEVRDAITCQVKTNSMKTAVLRRPTLNYRFDCWRLTCDFLVETKLLAIRAE